ncbi:MAG TPA: dihydrodipicolinate synthase family protein [Xanthobacteraceae bacterium]|nr:dihydrodipicolinate synthase family protein [Xanthobacteraceae bacterium]
MSTFEPGLVHTPVTPFTADRRIDFDLYARVLEFHLENGADSLALPMHVGESVSLTDAEKIEVLAYAIGQVKGRVPVIAHVSQSGTSLAENLARKAEAAGASAIIATTPYYWTPQPPMMLEHFVRIGSAVRIPFYVYNSPEEMGGTKITTDLTLKLLGRLDNFVGLVDASLDWQFLIDVVSNARAKHPDFQLLSGYEYLISAGAIGARGAFAPHAGIAPNLVRRLYERCRQEAYNAARGPQEDFAELRHAVKAAGFTGLKGAMRLMGRDVGAPRAPVPPLKASEYEALAAALNGMAFLQDEPRGW